MIDHFQALADALDAYDWEQAKAAAKAAPARRATRPNPAPPLPPGGFDGVVRKAQRLAKSLTPTTPARNYNAELNGLLAKAMAAFNAGKMTALEVAKYEDMVERCRHDCAATGRL